MKIAVCTVRDRQVDSYAQPMFVPTTGIAIRSFIDAVNTENQNSDLWKHPEDFELWHIANYDDQTGTFENLTKISLAIGSSVKTAQGK